MYIMAALVWLCSGSGGRLRASRYRPVLLWCFILGDSGMTTISSWSSLRPAPDVVPWLLTHSLLGVARTGTFSTLLCAVPHGTAVKAKDVSMLQRLKQPSPGSVCPAGRACPVWQLQGAGCSVVLVPGGALRQGEQQGERGAPHPSKRPGLGEKFSRAEGSYVVQVRVQYVRNVSEGRRDGIAMDRVRIWSLFIRLL